MQQPEGFLQRPQHIVCKPHKAIYGLKQVPWFSKLSSTLHQFSFTNTKSNPSLFTRFTTTSTIYILVYVDDILIIGNNPSEISDLITQLHHIFSLKDLGLMHYFLGIEANYTHNGQILLTQTKYVQDLLSKVGMATAKVCLHQC